MQSNPISSFCSQSLKAVDFSQLVCFGRFVIQTQRNYSIQISLHKKNNATWVRIASFWKEAVLLTIKSGNDAVRALKSPVNMTYSLLSNCRISSSITSHIGSDKIMSSSSHSRVTLYTAGHLHTAVPHCSHSRAPIVHTAVPRENNEHGCVYLRCRAVCKLPGCVEGHP